MDIEANLHLMYGGLCKRSAESSFAHTRTSHIWWHDDLALLCSVSLIYIVAVSGIVALSLISFYSGSKLPTMAPSNLPSIFNATSQDIEMFLAAQTHLGSKNLQVHMEPYLWKTRPDGVNVMNIGKTW